MGFQHDQNRMDAKGDTCRMDIDATKQNALALTGEMQWLAQVIDIRMKLYWQQPCNYNDVTDLAPPELAAGSSQYADILAYYKIGFAERVVLLLALAPHLQPHLLDVFFVKNADYDRGFTEFGGI